MGESRGTIAYFATYRPPVALEIFSSPYKPNSISDEVGMTDGISYNYNGQNIPPPALITIIRTIRKNPKLQTAATEADVRSGQVTGLTFVSERTNNLEVLHIGLRFVGQPPRFVGQPPKVEVFNFAEVYNTFKGTRMEDSGFISGKYFLYVSTMQRAKQPHQPWTAVYKTDLETGATTRLTPVETADFNPSVSPDGRQVAVASLQAKGGWNGEIEDLQSSIFIFDVENPNSRRQRVTDAGWPSWASNNTLFFHRNTLKNNKETKWGVFHADISCNSAIQTRVTPVNINCITPVAIDQNRVAVATLRRRFDINDPEEERHVDQYRHIEIYDIRGNLLVKVTETIRPKADHFSPFVIPDYYGNGLPRIAYHRCDTNDPEEYRYIGRTFDRLQKPDTENVDLIRVSGVFPSFSPDGSRLAFVDNEFKAVWVADEHGLFIVHETSGPNSVFAPVWNQNPSIVTLYVTVGPSFSPGEEVEIGMIQGIRNRVMGYQQLTDGYNNAFPATSPDGTRLVYRSTRCNKDGNSFFKNLYIMNPHIGDSELTQLTTGKCIDTQCQWSPNGKWIVFASNRDNPTAKAPPGFPDGGFFGIYLTMANHPGFNPIRVINSGERPGRGLFPGYCVHPYFSPNGKSLVFSADLAAVSIDPISLPLFVHSVRPYGDIFMLNLDMTDIYKNRDIKNYTRITHSRYENSTATWTNTKTTAPYAKWKVHIAGNSQAKNFAPTCPHIHQSGAHSCHMTGHLPFVDRLC